MTDSIRDELAAALRKALPFIERASEEQGYGFYRPDNPHDFCPDGENSPEEHAAHKAACEAYDKGTYVPDHSDGWIAPGIHVTKAPWGTGCYVYRDPDMVALVAEIKAQLAKHDAATPSDPKRDSAGAVGYCYGVKMTTTRTTPGALSAVSWEQAVAEWWNLDCEDDTIEGERAVTWVTNRARELDAARTPASPAVTAGDEIAWLIEMCDVPGTGNYWGTQVGRGIGFGTIDKAVRFARKGDAESVMRKDARLREMIANGCHVEATEHCWVAALAKQSQPADVGTDGEEK